MKKGIDRLRFLPKTFTDRGQDIGKQDYKAKLWKSSNREEESDVIEARSCPYADQVRRVIHRLENGVAFQSLAVASLQTLQKVLACEKAAAEAAISLAQGEKLNSMIETSEVTSEAISEALDAQGTHMLNLTATEPVDEESDRSWWFALTETIQVIEEGTHRILSLAAGQPKGGPGRQLSAAVVRLLRNQHHQLLAEADAWIA